MHSLNGYSIRRFDETDADELSECFRRIYGDHYPSAPVTDPAYFIAGNREGRLVSFVAEKDRGIVGHCALKVGSAPFEGLLEIVHGVVAREHRGAGIFGKLSLASLDEARSRSAVCGVFATAVANHNVSQRVFRQRGMLEAGFEIDYVPELTFAREDGDRGAISTVVQYLSIRRRTSLEFYPPEELKDLIGDVLRRLGEDRDPSPMCAHGKKRVVPGIEIADLPYFDVIRSTVHCGGAEIGERLEAVEQLARDLDRRVLQLVVNLGRPEAPLAATQALEHGYWFASVLPRWFDSHGLLLQKSLGRPNFEAINLYSDAARQLLARVQRGWLKSSNLTTGSSPSSGARI